MKACTVVVRGEKGPLSDLGSELLLGEGESSARIIIGMKKKHKMVSILPYDDLQVCNG